jgi:lysophospholipid acyltransferase (LPLAT)-like uncharacterized protein
VKVVPESPSAAKRIEKPRRLKWRHHIAAFLIFSALRILSWTWRMRLHDPDGVLPRLKEPVIICLWHNRLALAMRMWERIGKPNIPGEGLVALISASHDGGILARVLAFFGVEAVRGSSSRRGPQALLELTSWADRSYSIAITPDGPRGPCYRIHDGILALAQVTGRTIIPVSTGVRGKVRLKSWDKFQVPLPFASCVVRIGEPLALPREMTDAEREHVRAELKQRMESLTTD